MSAQQVYDKHRGPSDPPWQALPAVARRGWAVAARATSTIQETPVSQPTPSKPVFDVLNVTFGEALGIYLYAHLQIDDPRDVGQAEVIRGKRSAADHSEAAWIYYVTRGADSQHRQWEIAPSPDEFAFDLQQTLNRYAAGLVDAAVAEAVKAKAAAAEAYRLANPDPVESGGADVVWPVD